MANTQLTPEMEAALRARIERDGLVAVAHEIGISRNALLAALAGTGARPGTYSIIRERMSPLMIGDAGRVTL